MFVLAKPRAAGGTLLDKIVLVGAGIVVFVGLVLARIAGGPHWSGQNDWFGTGKIGVWGWSFVLNDVKCLIYDF